MTNIDKPKLVVTDYLSVQMMDYWFFMKWFGFFMKELAKMLMVLESNIKAIKGEIEKKRSHFFNQCWLTI